MEKITAGVLECFCDAFLLGPEGEPLYISFFDRSAQNVRAVGASLLLDGRVVFGIGHIKPEENVRCFMHRSCRGKSGLPMQLP